MSSLPGALEQLLAEHRCGITYPNKDALALRSALKFLHDQAERLSSSNGEKKEEIVADFCHVLMNANEFLYID